MTLEIDGRRPTASSADIGTDQSATMMTAAPIAETALAERFVNRKSRAQKNPQTITRMRVFFAA